MSIASEIQRLQTAKEDIVRALSRKGIEIPSGSTLDEFAEVIDPLTSGKTIGWVDNPDNYLSFKFVTDGSVRWQNKKGDIQYSKDAGTTWTYFSGATVSCDAGDEVWFKGSLTGGCGDNGEASCSKFYTSGKFYVAGNVQSLCGFNSTLVNYHFAYLFYNNVGLNMEASNAIVLPATTLSGYCYYYMFAGCTSLTTAPELPATTLAQNCYGYMFRGCTSLTTVPELTATTLANYCYYYMFAGCTSLTTAPELPATTLASGCYSGMFQGCTSLTTAPELTATTLAQGCYSNMFSNCTSLTTAPELPASTLTQFCYDNMFQGCTSLTTAPELPATTLANYCYNYMFNGCTSLTTAPELPATTLTTSCYSNMFQSCTSLTTAPELPATTLAQSCYYFMFGNCTSLTTAPELPATTLANYCYNYMFQSCTNLNYIKCLATNPSTSYTSYWVSGVQTTSGTFVKNPNTSSWTTGDSGIPTNWTVQDAS